MSSAAPSRRSAPGDRGGWGVSAQLTETPQQRDRAVTIYERSKPGRRAFVAPETGVPERPLDELIPGRLRRAPPAPPPPGPPPRTRGPPTPHAPAPRDPATR